MRLRLTLLLYNLLLPFGLLILLPASLIKMRRRGGYGRNFGQRFGFFRPDIKQILTEGQGRTWWLHAVSVGEVNVALKLIGEIRSREPNRPLVLSVTTSTGHAVARQFLAGAFTLIYSPVDLGFVVRRVLRIIRPEKYILMEAELWPNLVRRATRQGIPVLLANARLSPRSERRYRAFRAIAGPLFSMLDRVMVQEHSDVARWQSIGVPADRITVTGSIKYDPGAARAADRAGEFRTLLESLWGRPLPRILLAASTHNGEEKLIAASFLALRREFPNLVYLAVPRHFERRAEVSADLTSLGITHVLRSTLPLPAPVPPPDALIVDSTGELRDWQALADVVVVGKSFLTTGGQNPAEAVTAGVPTVTGPHMENFEPLMEVLHHARGITTVPSADALLPALREILASPDFAREGALRGREALQRHRDATARTAAIIAGQVET